ncbi:MAG: TrkA family potassium uptake protein [Rubripirellula sp.]
MNKPGQRSAVVTERPSHKTLRQGLSFFVGTCLVASVGYVLAGWEWVDAIYMVVITIFGVGYGEVQPIEETWLKFFTMGVIFAGCSSLIYVIGGIVQMLTEGEIERMLGTRSRSRDLQQLQDHTIICGYGRVGQMLAVELANHGQSLVVLDNNGTRVQEAINDGFLALEGDAINDDTLIKVGLLRARTLASVLPNDAANVFITLTARDLCETVRIIARAESPTTERKLLRGGATSVVMPAAIGAVRIAQLAISTDHDGFELPEERFRMLCPSRPDGLVKEQSPDNPSEEAVQDEVEELAHLASDLTRQVVAKHYDEITEQ